MSKIFMNGWSKGWCGLTLLALLAMGGKVSGQEAEETAVVENSVAAELLPSAPAATDPEPSELEASETEKALTNEVSARVTDDSVSADALKTTADALKTPQVTLPSGLTTRQALDKLFSQIELMPNYSLVATNVMADMDGQPVMMDMAGKKIEWTRLLEELLKTHGLAYIEDEGLVKIGTEQQLATRQCEIKQGVLNRNKSLVEANFGGGTPLMKALQTIRKQAGVKMQFDYMEPADRTDIVKGDSTNAVAVVKTTTFETPDGQPVEWRDVLAQVLDPNGYGYFEDCGVVKVMTKSNLEALKQTKLAAEPLVTRLIRLYHADPEKVVANIGKIPGLLSHPSASISVMSGWNDKSKTYPGAAGGTVETVSEGQSAGGEVATIGFSSLRRMPTPPALMVRDVESNLDRVENEIRALDKKERQVLIEARILDLGKTANRQLGVAINQFGGAYGANIAGAYVGGARSDFLWSRTAILNPLQMSATWQAIENENDLKVVSQPVIVVGDHDEAVIRVATMEPVLQLTTDYVNDSQNIAQSYEWLTLSIGITLWVVPEISADGRTIRLSIHPQITEKIGDSVEAPDGSQYPVVEAREIDTRVSVPTGSTLMMGGLLKSRGSNNEKRVPYLGRIPLIGRLFRGDDTDNSRRNLVMLITPTILDEENPDTQYEANSGAVIDSTLEGMGKNLSTNAMHNAERSLERKNPKANKKQ